MLGQGESGYWHQQQFQLDQVENHRLGLDCKRDDKVYQLTYGLYNVKIPGAGAEACVWLENRRAKMAVSRCKRVRYILYLRGLYTICYPMVARGRAKLIT